MTASGDASSARRRYSSASAVLRPWIPRTSAGFFPAATCASLNRAKPESGHRASNLGIHERPRIDPPLYPQRVVVDVPTSVAERRRPLAVFRARLAALPGVPGLAEGERQGVEELEPVEVRFEHVRVERLAPDPRPRAGQ